MLIGSVLLAPVKAAGTATPYPTQDPAEIVVDTNCAKAILEGIAIDANNQPICNTSCVRGIIYDGPDYTTPNGHYCVYGSTSTGAVDTGGSLIVLSTLGALKPSQQNTVLIYVRGAIYLVLGAGSLAVILYGLYGWYLRAMSEGNPDKIAESVKVYKNAVIGIIIIIAAIIIAQLTFVFMGVTDSPFEFDFIPISGYEVVVTPNDVGRYCYSNQIDTTGVYQCDPATNKWAKK